MRRVKLLVLLIFVVQFGFSQRRGGKYRNNKNQTIKGYISGNIIDSVSTFPIEFAIVELLSAKSDKQVDGTITEEDGSFKLKNVKTGKYKLKVSFLGYTEKIVNAIDLTLSAPDKKIGNVLLNPSSFMLDDIQIVDQRSLVESKIDKIVYNVSKDPTLTGGDATDVLRKVPMLTVDMEGNVSLRGSEKVKILLNGKPSGLFADDVGEALQMFPADEIKKVEVLTSPGAKYDGEGSAGIINIVTKKGIIKGIKGSVRSFFGDKMESLHGSLAVGKGRFGINTRIGARYKLPAISTNYKIREQYDDVLGTSILEQNGETDVSRMGLGGVLGVFYDFNAYNSINSNVRIRGHQHSNEGSMNVSSYNNTIGTSSAYKRTTENKSLRSTYNWTTDFTKKFKSNKYKKLVIATQLEGNFSTKNNTQLYDFSPNIENNDNIGINREITLQLDYVHPLSENVKMEVGAKSILRNINSDFSRVYNLKETGVDSTDNYNTDVFHYNQNVYAGYLSSTTQLPNNWGVIAGIRFEKTYIEGDFDNFESKFSNDYNNWFPSITISKRFKDFSNIKFSYNQRIHRPSLRYINPFIDNSDPKDIVFGNPSVSPEHTEQFELGYSKFMKGSTINLSAYFRNTDDVIESFLYVDTFGISNTTYLNIGKTNYYGFNVFTSVKLLKILELRGNFDINKYFIEGTVDTENLQNDGITYNGFLSSTITVFKDWKAEIWGFFRSPRYTLQGQNPSFSMYSFGVQKEVFNKKGRIGLRIVEPFHATKNFVTELEGDNFYQKGVSSIPFRSIGLTFSMNFGKLDFKERKSFIRNDDLKQGGGDDSENSDK